MTYQFEIKRSFTSELARRVRHSLPFMQAVLGPRGVGKTTGVLGLEKELGLPFYYCTADLPSPLGADWLREQWITARARAGHARGILVLDEVQKIEGWSDVVKVLFDEERRREQPLQVILLGSASWRLQSGLSESLAGRYEILRVPHWSYRECREAFAWDLTTFLKFGGYPAPVPLISEEARWQIFIRDSIIEPMLSRDLLSLRAVAKPALFRQTLHLALSYPAQEISLDKLLGQMQDRGNSTTIKGYLELLEAGFILRSLPKYSTRPLSRKSSSPKILPLCSALIHAFASPKRFDEDPTWHGRVFEAAIGARLALLSEDLHYWRDGTDEVDYVVPLDEQLLAIEVKSGRPRRSGGLAAFRERFADASTLVINREIGEQFLLSDDPRSFLLEHASAR